MNRMIRKKLLITGCTGYVGKNFVDYYSRMYQDDIIYGISRNSSYKNDRIKLIQLDLLDPGLEDAVLQVNPDYIIHLASERFGDLNTLFRNNVLATENLLNAALKLKNKHLKILVAGSSAEIGLPITNTSLNEESFCQPVDNYGITKLQQSHLARSYQLRYQLNITRLRFFNIIGPGLPDTLLAGKVIREFIRKIGNNDPEPIELGNISSYRDYIDIRDINLAIEKSLHSKLEGELYHIGGGKSVSGYQLLKTIIDTAPFQDRSQLLYKEDSSVKPLVSMQVAEIGKARDKLMWEPKVSLEMSLKNMWDYFA